MRIRDMLADHETTADAPPAPGPLSPNYVPPQPAPEPEPEPQFSIGEDDWNQVTGTLAQVADFVQRFQAPFQQPQQQQGPTVPDPFADDYAQQLEAYVNSRIAPIAQTVTSWQNDQGEELARDILSDIASKDGDFDQGMARQIADRYLPEMQAQHGYTRKAAEAALERAAADVREWEQRVGQAYHEQKMNQLKTLSGAPRQVPSGPAVQRPGAQSWSPDNRVDELEVVRRYGGHA